jgi:hypothetical protein
MPVGVLRHDSLVAAPLRIGCPVTAATPLAGGEAECQRLRRPSARCPQHDRGRLVLRRRATGGLRHRAFEGATHVVGPSAWP